MLGNTMALKQRVITAIIGWIIAFSIILLASLEIFHAVIGLIAVLSFNELLRMYKVNEETNLYIVAIVFFIAVCCTFVFLPHSDLVETTLISAPLIILMMALLISKNKESGSNYVIKIIFSGIYTFFILYMSMLRQIPNGKELVFILSAGTWGRDLTAFIFGRLIKSGHVIMPTVSSRKTYEGAIFALLITIFIVMLSVQWLLPTLTFVNRLAIGIGIGVFGQIGDLVESWLKRSTQVIDSSKILPGQGGILDSFDSFIFTAPFMYLYVTLILMK